MKSRSVSADDYAIRAVGGRVIEGGVALEFEKVKCALQSPR